jgi:hypothetical protein
MKSIFSLVLKSDGEGRMKQLLIKQSLIKQTPKTVLFIFTSIVIMSCATTPPPVSKNEPQRMRSQFQEVWNQITSDKLVKLPQDKVSFDKLFSDGKSIIQGRANRTLKDHADIIKPFDKLAHPNGVCFKGIWNIHASSKYSGYFKKNTKGLIIVRASTAMSNTRQDEIRSFGFAGKLFPTMNPSHVSKENTANFFLIDDLGGTRAKHYTDVELTNEPSISKNSEVFKNLMYVLQLASAFSKADKNPKIRQVYEISQLGEVNKNMVITPKWMKVAAQKGQTVDAKDFRDELRIANNGKLIFSISVASEKINNKKNWKDIGTITLDTSVISTSCDHRLHFHHPEWKSNLKH